VQPKQQFAENLRRLRLDAGISQIELSDRCGLHFTEISRLERGVRDPRLATIAQLARGLGVDATELVAGIP
jgi:transcriptional regulator with XRE-family HTH domain